MNYSYNVWGVCDVSYTNGGGSTTAVKNNLRYRGYYYDSDLGLYYLQSRYYDPNTSRFVNADSYISTGHGILGYNMFAYCNNNPVNFADPSGHFAISTLIIGALVGAAVGFGASVLSQSLTGDKKINWSQVALDTIIGGISGALGASGINQIVSIIAGGVLGAASSVGGDLIASNGDWSQVNVWKAVVMGGVGALLGRWTGSGTQNTGSMIHAINAGKSWGSKAFLTSAKEALLRPNSGLILQTMYMNMSKAINLYVIQGITKVSAATFMSTFSGNAIGW